MKFGELEQIADLRLAWKHEANDFTPWLVKEENQNITFSNPSAII